eukprot:jgi/Picre1/32045/NNA_007393.t1
MSSSGDSATILASVSSSIIQNVDPSMGMKKDGVSRQQHVFDGKTDQQQMTGRRFCSTKNTDGIWMKGKGMSAVLATSAVPWLLAGYGGGGQARAVPLWKLGRSDRIRGGWGDRSDAKPRIMILMSDTGGGHRASAEALRGGFEHLYGPNIGLISFDEYRPNLIISVHPLMQHVPVKVLRRRIKSGLQDPNTAFATVVTDLTTCHNTVLS